MYVPLLRTFTKELTEKDARAAIGIYNPPDVRKVLKMYEGKDIPREFAKHEADSKRRHIEEMKAHGRNVRPSPFSRASCAFADFRLLPAAWCAERR